MDLNETGITGTALATDGARRRHLPQAAVRTVARLLVMLAVVAVVLFHPGGWQPSGAAPTVSGPTTVTGPGRRAAPDVAAGGSGHLVVWQQPGSGTGQDIYGRRVGADGSALGGSFPIARTVYDETEPAVAWNGSNFLVVWEFHYEPTDTDVRARAVSAAGVAGPDTYAVSGGNHREEAPDIVGAGTNFLVVWSDLRDPAEGWDIWARGAQPTGGRLEEFRVAGDETRTQLTEPAAAADGSGELLVSWQRNFSSTVTGVFAQRTTLGIRLGEQLYLSPPTQTRNDAPAVASDGNEYLVVWAAGVPGSLDVLGERVDAAGAQLGERPVSTGAGDQTDPTVAFGSGAYLVGWTDRRRSTGPDIFATPVSRTGVVAEPSGLPVAVATGPQDRPSISGGGGWAVAHESGDDPSTTILLRRVSAK